MSTARDYARFAPCPGYDLGVLPPAELAIFRANCMDPSRLSREDWAEYDLILSTYYPKGRFDVR